MSKLSVGGKTATYVASAALVSLLVIVASTLYLGIPAIASPSSVPTSSTSLAGPQSLLVVQLTDPPQVPLETESLNMTYSSLTLVVGEPSGNGTVNPTDVSVPASGGSATLDLLKLQNVSQTVASASLPNGSVIYSVTFTVSAMAIDVNGTVSSLALATGGDTFSVTISQPSSLQGENVALLQLNPIVVGTPSGYQLIPSSVGVIKHSQGQGQEQVGSQQQLTQQDNGDLKGARGSLSADLVLLSVSGNTTSMTVQVRNTGGAPVTLNAIGLHGNFTTTGSECPLTTTSTTSAHGSSSHTQTQPGGEENHRPCQLPEHMNEVVFVPAAPNTTSGSSGTTACVSAQLKLVGGDQGNGREFVLQAGQCANFVFSGSIGFGESGNVLVPSTGAGQTYDVHVIATSGANVQLTCALPLGANSCKTDAQQDAGNGH